MSKGLEPIDQLRKRIEKIAKELNLNVSIFNLSYGEGEEKPMIQIVFGVSADAVKDAQTLEQEGIDQTFEALVSGFVEAPEEEEEEDEDVTDVMDDLKKWMDGDDTES